MRLDPAIAEAPITKIVGLNGGRAALINERAIIGFTRLEDPPLFAKDMGAYPYPLELYGGGDVWWLVSSSEREQKLIQVAPEGTMREITKVRDVRVRNVMFSDGKSIVACTREGGNIHKRSFYVLDPAADSAMRGPRKLPDDTMQTCLWRGSIVSGGAGRQVFKTSIAQ